jgi:hypothetical protein
MIKPVLFPFLPALALVCALAQSCQDMRMPVVELAPPPAGPDSVPHARYEWTIEEFGTSGYLMDVYARNDTDAFAVGDISYRDSTGKLHQYNALHWNGDKWSYHNILCRYGGTDTSSRGPLMTTSIEREGELGYILCQYGWVSYYDGKTVIQDRDLIRQGADFWRTWGSTGNRYYCGSAGKVFYGKYPRSYAPEPVITDVDLTDIWGNRNEVISVGGSLTSKGTARIIKVNGTWCLIDTVIAHRQKKTWTVWTDDNGVTGNGFAAFGGYGIVFLDTTWKSILTTGEYGAAVIQRIRGRSRTDVWAVGDWGRVLHYNGASWHWYDELWSMPNHRLLYGVAVTENFVFFAGSCGSGGVLITGRKQ